MINNTNVLVSSRFVVSRLPLATCEGLKALFCQTNAHLIIINQIMDTKLCVIFIRIR